ncbi:MAG: GNAT family N-acetyltransferase [Bacteroidetes bacterium]|nr:GNAT family N-acetyltransferase [Bacteroidota bacterium]HET6245097.1 GNAT family N-acetyltransferase [Bacteroidia bacterium]
MKDQVSIKSYETKDKSFIMALLKMNTPKYFSPKEENDLIYYLENEIENYFVVEYEKKIVACGGINFSDDLTTAKISWDIIHPHFQAKGIGSLLLNHRLTLLKSFNHLQIISVRTSQLAYKFYEKHGFKLVEVSKDYWAKGFDLYRMEKRQQ